MPSSTFPTDYKLALIICLLPSCKAKKQEMVRQGLLVVHVMVFSWLINITTVLAYGAYADRSRCPTSCGNLSNIPFPFGIRSSCYLDSWFEIVCNKSTLPHIPFLKRTNLQVLNITLADYNHAGTVRVFK